MHLLLQNTSMIIYLQSALKKKGNAGVAQLVERHLAKVEVAGSSLVSRSIIIG